MRLSIFLAAIPFVLGCAQQSVLRGPDFPSDEPLTVRLHQPTGRSVSYDLSEPAYVAIFAVRRGEGVSMIFPFYQSQVDYRSRAGFNEATAHGNFGVWRYRRTGGGYDESALLARADAYYVIASKYPLPVDELVNAPFLLHSLVGDVFRASNLSETWSALEAILVDGVPDDAWASDVYLNWLGPVMTMAFWEPPGYGEYCREDGTSMASSFFSTRYCPVNQRITWVTQPPVVAGGPRLDPPQKPLDRDPSVPLPPDEGVARISRISRFDNGTIRSEHPRRDAESAGAAIGRASDRSSEPRSDPPRAAERPAPAPAPAAREQPSSPPPSRPSEAGPSRQPSSDGGSRPQPKPDN